MDPVKKILFPIDFSPSCFGMALYVQRAARLLRAEVTLIHVIDLAGFTALEGLELYTRPPAEVMADHRAVVTREKLDSFFASDLPPAEFHRVLATGDPATAIAATIEEQRFDLVIMPTHAGHRFRRMLLGSTTAKVLNESACPVLTSTHSETVSPRTMQHKRWLCAIDLTPYSKTVLSAAKRLADQAQGELSIVHVVPDDGQAESIRKSRKRVSSPQMAQPLEQVNKVLTRVGLAASAHVSAGQVKECLLEAAAAETADVLIMGRSGTAKSPGAVAGSHLRGSSRCAVPGPQCVTRG